MLNVDLIKSLSENGETVLDYIENPKSHEMLEGAEVIGERAAKALEDLNKYLIKKGSKSSVSMVAFKLDKIAKHNGKHRKPRAEVKAVTLSKEEYKKWQDDMAKSDDNFNEAGVKCIKAERVSCDVVVVSSENMHIVDAEEMLMFMDSHGIDLAWCDGYEYSRAECYKALKV